MGGQRADPAHWLPSAPGTKRLQRRPRSISLRISCDVTLRHVWLRLAAPGADSRAGPGEGRVSEGLRERALHGTGIGGLHLRKDTLALCIRLLLVVGCRRDRSDDDAPSHERGAAGEMYPCHNRSPGSTSTQRNALAPHAAAPRRSREQWARARYGDLQAKAPSPALQTPPLRAWPSTRTSTAAPRGEHRAAED